MVTATQPTISPQTFGKPRFMLYIPTDSECSQLVKTKASRFELEKILRQASILNRPDGSRRRLKRFYLIDNYRDNAIVHKHDVPSLHASIHSLSSGYSPTSEYDSSSSTSDHDTLNSPRRSSTPATQHSPVSQHSNLASEDIKTTHLGDKPVSLKGKLNPLASVFCPTILSATPEMMKSEVVKTTLGSAANSAGQDIATGNEHNYTDASQSHVSTRVSSLVTHSGPVLASVPLDSMASSMGAQYVPSILPSPAIHDMPFPDIPQAAQPPEFTPKFVIPNTGDLPSGCLPMGGSGLSSLGARPLNLIPLHFLPHGFQSMPPSLVGNFPMPSPGQGFMHPGMFGISIMGGGGQVSQLPPQSSPSMLGSNPVRQPPASEAVPAPAQPSPSADFKSVTKPPPIPPPGNQDPRLQQNYEYYKYTFGNRRNGRWSNDNGCWKNRRSQFRS